MSHPDKRRLDEWCALDRKLQLLLASQWRTWPASGIRPCSLSEVEFRTFSQNGEDGVLLYIFTLIGMKSRRVVEICAGTGQECNAANLIVNHGWRGLLVDGNQANIDHARQLYASLADTFIRPPAAVCAWVTRENVNDLIESHGFTGEIDLLSIDVDGNDYWLWQAIDVVQPRVVCIEYNAFLGPDRAVTVPYDPAFVLDFSRIPYFAGASLPAFVKLGRERGYRLVGTTRHQINAFFVKEELADGLLPAVEAASCLDHWREFVNTDWRGQTWLEV